jgi:hypothetical protein
MAMVQGSREQLMGVSAPRAAAHFMAGIAQQAN